MTAQVIQPTSVLVVDDETTVCRSVEKILTRCGYRVHAACSVAAAIGLLDDGHHVDLVLIDLMMPAMSGMEFNRAATQRWPRLPVVVITGYASVGSAVEATRLGAADYLAKPFTPKELEVTVANAISAALERSPRRVNQSSARGEPANGNATIDVDLPFDPDEVAKATSPAYVEHLTRSDVTILDSCHLGDRQCRRFIKKGVCRRPECPIVVAERKRAVQGGPTRLAEDPIDVDLPFGAREVAAITGEAYVRALGRGDMPVTGRWPRTQRTRRRVLAVDDEAVVVQAIRRSLAGRAYHVDEAFSGHAALARVANERYDLVLLDMRMPDLNGLELLSKIRECQPTVPVVIVTGYPTIETAVEAIQKGAADYLAKPFTPEELRQTTDRVLRRAA